ncbi:DNA methyltransferase, partial [Campylobacter jejuni]|nr:DNA methyltransferase [Campylobacter jejuni]
YEFLYENDLNSIKWTLVKNNEPFYLFLPQNNDLLEEYNKGISVKDIFMLLSVGIVSAKDSILISTNTEKLKQQIHDYYNEFDKKNIKEIAYRPFDTQKIYYDIKKVERPRIETMEHFLENENIGLICDRGTKLNNIDNIFISSKIIDLHLVGSGSYIYPLYLYPTTRSKKFLKKENPNFNEENFTSKIENFKESFRTFIDELYKEKFSPQNILGYIYAVLFHKIYREKYFDFLKIDFPKIPFTKDKNTFKNLS